MNLAAWICLVLVFANSLFHALLIFGAPLGEYVLGGKHRVLPAHLRFVSLFFLVYFLLMGFAYLTVLKGHVTPFAKALILVNTAFQAWAIIGNSLTKSQKERRVMRPLSAVECVASLIVWINL
ncbi:MAG: hypothetical protein LBI11_07160 [Streptococcaceae bacterium]|jgi:hypothetical protein|nr:hypothetical protein [Streptococcaceae bacterium]